MTDGRSGGGPIPPRWLHCPRKANQLIDKFLAFKTPLSSAFNVPQECTFTVKMLFSTVKSQKQKIGLWIDLTNTTRFYDKAIVEEHDCKYLKLPCRGHGETPSKEQTQAFIQICSNFIAHHPLEIIGVHCTHGFNRTGFLVISYLVEASDVGVDVALAKFASVRSPGIYKGDYINELFKRYGDGDDAPLPPLRPVWCLEDEEEDDDAETMTNGEEGSNVENKKRKREFNRKNPVFMAGVPGVTPLTEQVMISEIQSKVQDMCDWKTNGFPGSQPVSMDKNNLLLLSQKPYRVSWKADGTRYMLLIQGDRKLFFLDRDNSVFQVPGLSFPHLSEQRSLNDTLLDGEMVIDKAEDGQKYPRYLVYDVVWYDGQQVLKRPFHPDRYAIIEKEIMGGRHQALKAGFIRREKEPFSIRLKEFYDITQAVKLCSDKFAKQLGHEPDGLIFQPSSDPYTPGPSVSVLKWKPPSLNSVDFKLNIVTESGEGILTRKIGQLFVGGLTRPFDQIELTKVIRNLNDKIIECKRENGKWVFMRERTDKAFPNSYGTAMAVWQSIRDPVTTNRLLGYIEKHRFVPKDTELMPPPQRDRRHDQRHLTYQNVRLPPQQHSQNVGKHFQQSAQGEEGLGERVEHYQEEHHEKRHEQRHEQHHKEHLEEHIEGHIDEPPRSRRRLNDGNDVRTR